MGRNYKRTKEWYRQAIEDLQTLTDEEILEKYGIVSRDITHNLSAFKLTYVTYGFITPAVWVESHTEKEFDQLVKDYNTIGNAATCAKYKITHSLSSYIAKRGLATKTHVRTLPDKNTIIRHIQECGGVDNLLKDIQVKYPHIRGSHLVGNLRSKIRRIGECLCGDNIYLENRLGNKVKSHTGIKYTREEAEEMVNYCNSHTRSETSKRYGFANGTSAYTVCKQLADKYGLKLVVSRGSIRIARTRYQDYKNMTIDAYVAKYRYKSVSSARSAMIQIVKRYGFKKEEV